MKYLLPKEIAKAYNVSLKTVYNYLNKHSERIRTKREQGKTFINLQDFESHLQSLQSSFKKTTSNDGRMGIDNEH